MRPHLGINIGNRLDSRWFLVFLVILTAVPAAALAIGSSTDQALINSLLGHWPFALQYWWFAAMVMLAVAILFGVAAAAMNPQLPWWGRVIWVVLVWFTAALALIPYCLLELVLKRERDSHRASTNA